MRALAIEHPASLERIDRDYLISWGRSEWSVALFAFGAITAVAVGLAWAHSPAWLLILAPVLPPSALLVLFFRNPRRRVPADPGLIVSPADGKITDITPVEEREFIQGPAVRIGIFLSIFSVHVNRAPAAGRVEWVCHREGAHHDARREEAAMENESNLVGLVRDDAGGPEGARLLVKQISGAIARRIICPLEPGMNVARGGLIGMIKYGSRTELYLPAASGARVRVAVGDAVKGGSTVIAGW